MESSIQIDAKIDSIIEHVYEVMDSEMSLDAAVSLLNQSSTGGQAEMVLTAEKLKAIKKDLIDVNSNLEISVAPLDYYIAHSFGKVDFDMKLTANQLQFLKEGFDEVKFDMEMLASAEFSSEKTADLRGLYNFLRVDPTGLFYVTTVSGSFSMLFSASPIDYVLNKIFYNLNATTYLNAENVKVFKMNKFTSGGVILNPMVELIDTLIQYISLSGSISILSCEASAGLKRYRMFSDMDDFALSEFDSMTLKELDFVTII
jgi:hypothetical protein